MRIEYDIKLGFKDVMIRPKRSTLKSRSEVNLEREFKFLHSPITWTGIPIIAANMDTVGTFDIAKALSDKKLFTAIHKHYSIADWSLFLTNLADNIESNIASDSLFNASRNEQIGLSQSALSQHLAILRKNNLASTRRKSQTIYYKLSDKNLSKIIHTLRNLYCK